MTTDTPTRSQYTAFDSVFAHFNRELFRGELPALILTFSRHAKAAGFFAAERWTDAQGGAQHEIALNPDTFLERTPEQVASTLVHEMVHLWQQTSGKPSRSGYHNAEWADAMDRAGLTPSDTGQPGGKRTGQRMTHYVEPGGAFARAFAKLPKGWFLPFRTGGGPTKDPKAAKKRASKTKYECPECGANVWGKPGLLVLCKVDEVVFVEEGAEAEGDGED